MATVSQQLIDTWNSGEYVGANTPVAVVQVQLGHWVRGWYHHDENVDPAGRHMPKVKASIWGEGGFATSDAKPGHWSAQWFPSSPWYDLPNLSTVKRTKDFSAKGVQVVEITLDALDYVPKVGALGDAYHAIAPGFLAWGRGYVAPGRARQPWQEPGELSDWAPDGEQPRIADSVKLRMWLGYGQPATDEGGYCPPFDGGANGAWVFMGQIDEVDLDGDPNVITITARNGKLLTDQRVFRACKSVQLKDPVTFYDREAARKQAPSGSSARASSEASGHPARRVLDRAKADYDPNALEYKSEWQSVGNIDAGTLEWVQVKLPQGNYDSIWLVSQHEQMAYVGIYARPLRHWTREHPDSELSLAESPPTMDGEPIPANKWVDLGHTSPGGWPYVRAFRTGSTTPDLEHGADGRRIDNAFLGDHVFELGEHSLLRVGFTRPSGSPAPAVASALFGMRRYGTQREIRRQQFILVDDATEIVKVVLRWAGFHQWDIDDAQVRLSDGTNYGPGVVAQTSGRLTFNRSNYLIDVIDELAKQLGWVYFIGDPTDAESDGVFTFRHDSSLRSDMPIVANLNDTTMLTALKTARSDESRPFIIRVRGKTATVRGGGVPLGGDSVRRLMAVYFPPWAFGSRCGGVYRHIVYQDDQIVTYAQALYGAMSIALNAAVAMYTATAEIPGHPLLELDDQVSIIDEATGTNSRLWITKTDDTLQLGQSASWKQTIQGALLDTADMHEVIAQMEGKEPITYGAGSHSYVLHRINWNRVRNPDSGHISSYPPPLFSGGPRRRRRVR